MNDLVKGAHITKLKQSMESAINSKEMQQVEFPLEHYFTPTQYARRIFVPADHTVVTAVHKSEHVTVALKGHCVVVDELGDRHDVIAPSVFITKPGTQRAIYAVTDTEWLTVHTYTDEDKSLDAVRKVLVCDTMEEYAQVDYKKSLEEIGVTEEVARAISEHPHDLIPMPETEVLTYIAPSKLEGLGVFAATNIEPNSRIAPARMGANRTPVGRYTNHSDKPNAYFVPHDGGVDLYANLPIGKSDEITVNYREALQASVKATQLWESQQ